MKINNTTPTPPASPDEQADISATKSPETNAQIIHPPSPEASSTINRLNNPQNTPLDEQNINTHLPPPVDLTNYAATSALRALQDKLLTAAESILLADTKAPAMTARNQVIDLVLKENFRTLLTDREQNEIADTLKRTLIHDPIFCEEVDNMLKIAAKKLEIDSQS